MLGAQNCLHHGANIFSVLKRQHCVLLWWASLGSSHCGTGKETCPHPTFKRFFCLRLVRYSAHCVRVTGFWIVGYLPKIPCAWSTQELNRYFLIRWRRSSRPIHPSALHNRFIADGFYSCIFSLLHFTEVSSVLSCIGDGTLFSSIFGVWLHIQRLYSRLAAK